jgi:hypothetical protein
MYDCHRPTRIVLCSKLNHILSGRKYGGDVCTICLAWTEDTKTKIVYYFSFSMDQIFEHRVKI